MRKPIAPITVDIVKNLKRETGYSMMECKHTLIRCNSDYAVAKRVLLKRKGNTPE